MKKITIKILLCLLFSFGNRLTYAQEPPFDWVKGFAPTAVTMSYVASVFTNGSVTDGDGNVYITGQFVGNADFDPGPDSFIMSNQSTYPTVFVSKLNAKGEFQWAKQIENKGTSVLVGGIPFYPGGGSYAYSIAIDKAANIYIAGHFRDTMDFDPGPGEFRLTSTPSYRPNFADTRLDGYVLKLDSSGSFIWAKQMVDAAQDRINRIIIDKDDHFFIAGWFEDSIDIDFSATRSILRSSPPNSNGDFSRSAFVAKYDTAGTLIWGKKFGSDSVTAIQIYDRNDAQGFSVDIDTTGAVYILGIFTGKIDFDPSVTGVHNLSYHSSSTNRPDIFLCKLHSDGTFAWVNGYGVNGPGGVGSHGEIGSYSLSTFGNDVYFTGNFAGTVDFDPSASVSNLTAVGSGADIVVAKYGSDGSYKWAKAIGSTGNDKGRAIKVNSSGLVHIVGDFSDTVDFDPGNSTHIMASQGSSDVFLCQWDIDANLIWAGGIQGNSLEEVYSIHLDQSNNIFTTGLYSSTVSDFDPNTGVYDMPHPFVFPGTTFSFGQSGFIHKLGCGITDSVSVSESACNEQYTYNGQIYNVSGTYVQVFPKSNSGCDSIITLNLTFYQLEPVITIDGFILGVSGTYTTYQWYKNGEYTRRY